MHLCQILLCPFGAKNPFFYERDWDQIGRKGSQININNHKSTITTVVTEFLINILSDIFQQNVSLLRNIILYEYSGVSFESNIALNHFLARFNEKMNIWNVSVRARSRAPWVGVLSARQVGAPRNKIKTEYFELWPLWTPPTKNHQNQLSTIWYLDKRNCFVNNLFLKEERLWLFLPSRFLVHSSLEEGGKRKNFLHQVQGSAQIQTPLSYGSDSAGQGESLIYFQ